MISQRKKKIAKEKKHHSTSSMMPPSREVDIFETFKAIMSSSPISTGADQADLQSPRKLRTPRTILFDIIVKNDIERLRSILDNEEISLTDEIIRKKRTIIHWFAYYGRTDMLTMLFGKEQVDLNARDSQGRTPLHLAALRGRVNCAKKIVEQGANWEMLDDAGLTSFQIAKGDKTKKYLMSLYEPDFPRCSSTTGTLICSTDLASSSSYSGPIHSYSLIHQVGLHDQHHSRRHSPSTIFDAYQNGASDIFNLLIEQNFDFSQPIGEFSLAQYVQKEAVHTKNWNLYRQLESKMLSKVYKANKKFEDAIMLNNFRAYLQQNVVSELELNDLDMHLNTILEGIIKPDVKPSIINGCYLSEFAHGIVEFYSPLAVFNRLADRFYLLTPLAKLRALYLIKELMLQDTDNRFIAHHDFKMAWKTFKKSLKEIEGTLYNSVVKQLNNLYEAKLDFYITAVPPLDMGEAPIALESLLASANTRKGVDHQLIEDLAQDIRQINAMYFLCLSPEELKAKSWQAINREQISANTVKLTNFFDGLAKMVAYDILALRESKARAKRISFYLDVAFQLIDETKGLPDYHGAHAILSGLANNSITRLKESWALLDSTHLVQKTKLEYIFSPLFNFRNLRPLQEKNALPFLGVLTRDLTFILDGNEPENAILLLGQIHLKLIQMRMSLLNIPFQIKTDILKFISRLNTVTDEELYNRSRYLEEHILVLKPNSSLVVLREYLEYRNQAKLGIKIQVSSKIIKEKQAFNSIFEWLKSAVSQQKVSEQESRQILELCFSLLTSNRGYKADAYIANLFSGGVTSRRRASSDSDSDHSPRVEDEILHASIEQVTHELEAFNLSMPVSSSESGIESVAPLILSSRSPGRTPREKKSDKMKPRSYSSTLPKGFGLSKNEEDQDSIPTTTLSTPRGKFS